MIMDHEKKWMQRQKRTREASYAGNDDGNELMEGRMEG